MQDRARLLLSLALLCWVSLSWDAFAGSGYVQDELRIPMQEAGPVGLEAYLVKPEGEGPFPLVVLSHGTLQDHSRLKGMTAAELYKQAVWFARRGFVAVSVMRRGYGSSGGDWPGRFPEDFGSCFKPDYAAAAAAAVADLRATIAYLSTKPYVDARHIVAAGGSAGGFATVALTADPPSGLVAAISFSGGRGSILNGYVCGLDQIVSTFANFGKQSRVPMLWIYAENDHLFDPITAMKFKDAFESAGNTIQFKMLPPFGKEGHNIFWDGIDTWSSHVDEFLKMHGLARNDGVLPAPSLPDVPTPDGLATSGPHGDGRTSFPLYLAAAPHKAFVMASDGTFNWRSSRRSDEEAINDAFRGCGKSDCRVFMLNDEQISQ